jgi:hypothetical protein
MIDSGRNGSGDETHSSPGPDREPDSACGDALTPTQGPGPLSLRRGTSATIRAPAVM